MFCKLCLGTGLCRVSQTKFLMFWFGDSGLVEDEVPEFHRNTPWWCHSSFLLVEELGLDEVVVMPGSA